MTKPSIHTLGELQNSGYSSRSIKEEMRQNLIPMLKEGKHPFKGIFGYEDTVLPAVERGILAAHDILSWDFADKPKQELLDRWWNCSTNGFHP